MRIEGDARDRARRTISARRLIPAAWPNAAAGMVAVGAALVATDIPSMPYLPLVGVGLAVVGAHHLGGLSTPDPVARARAERDERALLTLGIMATGDGTPRPAGGDGEVERVEPDDIPREPIRPGASASGDGPRRGLRLAPDGWNPDDAARAGDAEPPIGGPPG